MQFDNIDRAKQFLSFDALKGFREYLKLEEDKLLNDDINYILSNLKKGEIITVEYYYDLEYVKTKDIFIKIDIINKMLYLKSSKISIDDIISINKF